MAVYMYLQEDDFDEIIRLISSKHCFMISNKGKMIEKPRFGFIDDQEFNVYSDGAFNDDASLRKVGFHDHISITQQKLLGGMLQPMSVFLILQQQDDANRNEIVSLYDSIKKHVKKKYVISSDKMIYMGPQAYSDWKKRQFNTAFLFLLEKKVFYLSQMEFDLFLKWADSNYILFDYTHRLFVQGRRAFDYEEYCIADKMSNIIVHSTRVKRLRVDSDSCCVYVSRELKGKKRTTVYVDKRIINEQNHEIIRIFDMVVKYLTNINQPIE